MRKLAFIALAAWFFAAMPAAAQQTGFALDRFSPAPTSEDGLALILPRTLGHLRPSFGLTLDYAHKPLVVARPGSDADGAVSKHRLLGHVTGALGLGERFELFVRVPVLFMQRGDGSPVLGNQSISDSGAFGTLSLGGSARLAGEDDGVWQLGVTAWLDTPTGKRSSLTGDDGVGVAGVLSAAAHIKVFTLAANVGARYRPEADFGSAKIGSELLMGAGAYVRAAEPVTVLAELNGALAFRELGKAGTRSAPFELLAGVRYAAPINVAFTGAIGLGLTHAVGVPDMRALLQAGYPAPRESGKASDVDGDKIPDRKDRCPELPEDRDGFQDADGCPDLDNDRDGVADSHDQCSDQQEDADGIEDEDGCPDLDNDKDGIPDADDQCRNTPEDVDGFQDDDGCPDLDNDADGLADQHDQCPRDAEDHDGFADEDGCPDLDNDKDGILDAEDSCPTVPGPASGAGCPSAVRIDKQQIRILERIEFASKRAEITPGSLDVLDQVRSALEANPQIKRVRIEGHTDSLGPDQENAQLSQRRAEAVMKYLVREGIDPARLEAKGWGEERPLVANDGPANMQINRRVEFHLVDPAPPQSSIGGQQ